MEYIAQVRGTMTSYAEGEKIDSTHPFGKLEMYDVEANSLKQLVQKLADHFGTDVKQFLAGYSDDDENIHLHQQGHTWFMSIMATGHIVRRYIMR